MRGTPLCDRGGARLLPQLVVPAISVGWVGRHTCVTDGRARMPAPMVVPAMRAAEPITLPGVCTRRCASIDRLDQRFRSTVSMSRSLNSSSMVCRNTFSALRICPRASARGTAPRALMCPLDTCVDIRSRTETQNMEGKSIALMWSWANVSRKACKRRVREVGLGKGAPPAQKVTLSVSSPSKCTREV